MNKSKLITGSVLVTIVILLIILNFTLPTENLNLNGIRMSGFTTFPGISGGLQLAGLNSLESAILLIILGVYLIVKPAMEEKKLFSKAEHT